MCAGSKKGLAGSQPQVLRERGVIDWQSTELPLRQSLDRRSRSRDRSFRTGQQRLPVQIA